MNLFWLGNSLPILGCNLMVNKVTRLTLGRVAGLKTRYFHYHQTSLEFPFFISAFFYSSSLWPRLPPGFLLPVVVGRLVSSRSGGVEASVQVSPTAPPGATCNGRNRRRNREWTGEHLVSGTCGQDTRCPGGIRQDTGTSAGLCWLLGLVLLQLLGGSLLGGGLGEDWTFGSLELLLC